MKLADLKLPCTGEKHSEKTEENGQVRINAFGKHILKSILRAIGPTKKSRYYQFATLNKGERPIT